MSTSRYGPPETWSEREESPSEEDEVQVADEDLIFVHADTNKPVKFHLHNSVKGEQRNILSKNIRLHGGRLCDEEGSADTVIVSMSKLSAIMSRYVTSKTVWVEPEEFVKQCINRKKYDHAKPLRKGMGGRVHGASVTRTRFTVEDDYHLTRYLADRIPYKDSGGRSGNGIYKQLTNFKDTLYPWAERHTWQSWRERYKTNQAHFDGLIEEIVDVEKPAPGAKGQYHLERPAKKARVTPEEEEEGEEGEEGEEYTPGPRQRVGAKRSRARKEKRHNIEPDGQPEAKRRRSNRLRNDDKGVSSPELGRERQAEALDGQLDMRHDTHSRRDLKDYEGLAEDDPQLHVDSVDPAEQLLAQNHQASVNSSSPTRPTAYNAPFNSQMTLVNTQAGPSRTQMEAKDMRTITNMQSGPDAVKPITPKSPWEKRAARKLPPSFTQGTSIIVGAASRDAEQPAASVDPIVVKRRPVPRPRYIGAVEKEVAPPQASSATMHDPLAHDDPNATSRKAQQTMPAVVKQAAPRSHQDNAQAIARPDDSARDVAQNSRASDAPSQRLREVVQPSTSADRNVAKPAGSHSGKRAIMQEAVSPEAPSSGPVRSARVPDAPGTLPRNAGQRTAATDRSAAKRTAQPHRPAYTDIAQGGGAPALAESSTSGPARNTRARSRSVEPQSVTLAAEASQSTRKGKAAAGKIAPALPEAPYRNTRARSASVEPPPVALERGKSKRGKPARGKRPNMAHLAPVQEDAEDEADIEDAGDLEVPFSRNVLSASGAPDHAVEVGSIANGETQDEELLVEDALGLHLGSEDENPATLNPDEGQGPNTVENEKVDDTGGHNGGSDDDDDEEEEEEEEEEDSEADDDDDTIYALQAREKLLAGITSRSSAYSSPLSSVDRSHLYSTPRSVAISASRAGSALASFGHKRRVDTTATAAASLSKRLKRTSTRAGFSGATTEESDFPSPVTKARTEKQRRLMESKRLPFLPAPGTRAAEALLRNSIRKGKQRAI